MSDDIVVIKKKKSKNSNLMDSIMNLFELSKENLEPNELKLFEYAVEKDDKEMIREMIKIGLQHITRKEIDKIRGY
jgi:hypothetical protein